MKRSFAPVLFLLLLAMSAPAVRAQFDAPVWYVQYEVSMTLDKTVPGTGQRGPTTTVWKIERTFESAVKLDMRNMGQVLSMMEGNQLDPEKFKKMSMAEQLQYSQQMMDAMQHAANWMPGPYEGGDGQDDMLNHMKSVSVPVRLNYHCLTTGNNLVNETGSHYDYFEETTAAFTGGLAYTSPDQTKFEMNESTHKYWLSLPWSYTDMNTALNEVHWLTVTKYRDAGTTAWGPEERGTNDSGIDRIGGSFKFDALPNNATMPLIEGTFDGSGKISGVKSFTGRLSETGPDIPVTLTFKYTVTTTPPARAAGAK